MVKTQLKNEIKRARLKAGLTQRELAETIGVTNTWISHLENDHKLPSLQLLDAIAAACGVKLVVYFTQGRGASCS